MRTPELLRIVLGISGLVASVLSPRAASADCAASAPPSPLLEPDRILPINTRIVVERYDVRGGLRQVMGGSSLGPVGGGAPVPLRIETAFTGEMHKEQVVLVPARALSANSQYQLRLPGAPKPFPVRIGATADTTPPVWREAPRVHESHYTPFGCGPAVGVAIEVQVRDDGPQLFVRASVVASDRATEGPRPVSYMLVPQNSRITIGHDMCSGEFRLQRKIRYQVQLTAVDLAGNETPAPGPPLTIVGPSPDSGT